MGTVGGNFITGHNHMNKDTIQTFMKLPPTKLELRLTIQGSIPVDDIYQGEELYNALKKFIKNYSDRSILSGQVTKHLELCCQPPAKEKPDEKNPKIP